MNSWGILIFVIASAIVVYSIYRCGFSNGWKACEEKMAEDSGVGEEKETVEAEKPATDIAPKKEQGKKTTKDILLELLPQLQCRIVSEEDNVLDVRYQAEVYRLTVDGERPYLWIYDLAWYDFPEDDIDTFAKVKDIINKLNTQSSLGLVYFHNEETHTIQVGSKYTMLLNSDFPDKLGYLEHIFSEFARTRQHFFIELG